MIVEGQHVGTLQGFQFAPDPSAGDGESGRALRAAAAKALAGEIEPRAQKFAPGARYRVRARQRRHGPLDRRAGGQADGGDKALAPRIRLLADEQLDRAGARHGAEPARHLDRQPHRPPARPAAGARQGRGAARAWPRASPSSSSRRSASLDRSQGGRGPQAARPGTSAPRCASTACASAPITSICRP